MSRGSATPLHLGARGAISAPDGAVPVIEAEGAPPIFQGRGRKCNGQERVVAQQLEHPQFEQADYAVRVQPGIDQAQEGNQVIEKFPLFLPSSVNCSTSSRKYEATRVLSRSPLIR